MEVEQVGLAANFI